MNKPTQKARKLTATYEHRQTLSVQVRAWQSAREAIERRWPTWQQLGALLEHIKELGPYQDLNRERQAIKKQRALLADPNPVQALLDLTTEVLRGAESPCDELSGSLRGADDRSRARCPVAKAHA